MLLDVRLERLLSSRGLTEIVPSSKNLCVYVHKLSQTFDVFLKISTISMPFGICHKLTLCSTFLFLNINSQSNTSVEGSWTLGEGCSQVLNQLLIENLKKTGSRLETFFKSFKTTANEQITLIAQYVDGEAILNSLIYRTNEPFLIFVFEFKCEVYCFLKWCIHYK